MDRARDRRGPVLSTRDDAPPSLRRPAPGAASTPSSAGSALGRLVLRLRGSAVFQPESPLQPPRRWWAAGLLVGTLLVLLRVLASGASVNSLWAEDGSVFLQQSRTDGAAAVADTYAGYLHLLPRLLALAASGVPLRWAPAVITVLAALALAAMALLAGLAVSGHLRSPFLRVVLAAYVVLLPAGPETVGAIANLHWTLLFLAVCVLLWDPTTSTGRTTACVVLLVTATSNPFGVLFLPLALVRLVVLGRRGLPQLAALSAGIAVQGTAMAVAGDRDAALVHDPVRIAVWYVGDVLPTAVFGNGVVQRAASGVSAASLALGLGVLAVGLAAAVLLRRRDDRRAGPTAFVCLAGSVLLYTVLTGLSGVAPGRYSVPSVLLLVLAALLVLDVLLDGRDPLRAWRDGGAVRLGLLLLVVVAAGTATSVPALSARDAGPAWTQEVQRAEQECAGSAGPQAVLRIPPGDGWTVVLRCEVLA